MSEAFKTSHNEIQIVKAELSSTHLTAHLSDERIISIPVARFPRLDSALKNNKITPSGSLQISSSGYGIHWPDIDEDISIKAFL